MASAKDWEEISDELEANESGGHSLAVAHVERTDLFPSQFALIDTNDYGELSESELDAQLPDEEPNICSLPAEKCTQIR